MKCKIKFFFLTLFLLIGVQTGIFSPCQANTDKVTDIAQQMFYIAPDCQKLSSEEMKARRLQFLNSNKDATINDLVKAIEIKIDGQDIIELLDSFNCDVCTEYADSVRSDHSRGSRAIKRNFGDTSIETVMYWRLL